MSRQEIATVEDLIEDFGGKEVHGNLVLSTEGEIFQLYWTVLDSSPDSWLKAIVKNPHDYKENKWTDKTSFLVDAAKISSFSFASNPLRFCVSIDSQQLVRKFIIGKENIEQFTEFIEQIISYGIALPTTKEPYSLEVYKRCHKSLFVFQPLNINLTFDDNIDTLYNNILQYSCDIVSEYNKQGLLPNDPSFPLPSLVIADLRNILSKVPVQKEKKVEVKEWNSFFDAQGRFVKFEEVKRRACIAGIDDELIKQFLPFITKVFSPKSTKKERDEKTKELVQRFKCLKVQASTLTDEQKINSSLIGPYARVIVNDVKRTDRDLKCFVKDDGEGLKILTCLLYCYLLCFPHISYLQGMNDIFVPILTSFIPNWDDNSNPITNNLDEELAMVFWCYNGLIHELEHINVLLDITKECKRVSSVVVDTIAKISPCTKIWLNKSGNSELLFTFSDYVLLYKRSFPNIWRIWMSFLCNDKPAYSLSLFTSAVVMKCIPALCSVNDWSITTMMTVYPQAQATVDIDEAINIMLWLNSLTPKEAEKVGKEKATKSEDVRNINSFHYFKPGAIAKN